MSVMQIIRAGRITWLGTGSLLLAGALGFAGAASADTLQMKNGRVIEGNYLGGSERSVQFETIDGRVQLFSVKDIASVSFTGAPSRRAAAPPPNTPPPAYPPAQSNPPAEAYPPPQQQSYPPPQAYPPPQEEAQGPTPLSPSQYESPAYVGDDGSVVFPVGMHLQVRMVDSVDSQRNRIGDRFHASLDSDMLLGDQVVIPRGTDVFGRLSEAKEAGQLTGRAQLRLELTDIVVNNRMVPIVSGEYELAGKSRGGNTAQKAAGGAVIGAVIGAIAGGGKGAAIGAGVGAGAGTAINIVTRGEQVHIPAETFLDFRLAQPLTVRQ